VSDYDELAVEIVCVERVPMRLVGCDRVEAVRRLSAKGLQALNIAALLLTDNKQVTRLQKEHGITPAPAELSWYGYLRPPEKRVRYNAIRRANRPSRAAT